MLPLIVVQEKAKKKIVGSIKGLSIDTEKVAPPALNHHTPGRQRGRKKEENVDNEGRSDNVDMHAGGTNERDDDRKSKERSV